MFPEESPTSQDFQQAYAQTQLFLHAKHEIHYPVTQQNTPLRFTPAPTQQYNNGSVTAEEKTNALLKENASKQI